MISSGSERIACAGLLALLVACSGRTETFANTGSVDRVGADASVRDREPADSAAFTDTLLSTDVNAESDRWERYCNVPNPGPCCCEPFDLALEPPFASDGAIAGCDFTVTAPGRYRVRDQLLSLELRLPDGGRSLLLQEPSCTATAESFMFYSKDPVIVRLCPNTCQRFAAGEYAAVIVQQGCYAIYCP